MRAREWSFAEKPRKLGKFEHVFETWRVDLVLNTSGDEMSSDFVHYELADGVATIRIDDGKRNALSPEVFEAIYAALERAEKDRAVVILTGREGVFSAGFHLGVLRGKKPTKALRMLRLGYGLTARVLAFPYPVITACNGHCFAMGTFLMLSSDYVIGTRGDYKMAANEVAIGMTMPRVAAAILQHRLTPAAYQRTVTVSAYSDPVTAFDAGYFDELVEPSQLQETARERAEAFKALDMHSHKVSKRRIRRSLIRRIKRSLPLDLLDAALIGLRGAEVDSRRRCFSEAPRHRHRRRRDPGPPAGHRRPRCPRRARSSAHARYPDAPGGQRRAPCHPR